MSRLIKVRDFYNCPDYWDYLYTYRSYLELEHDFIYERPDLSHHFSYEGLSCYINKSPTGIYSLRVRGYSLCYIDEKNSYNVSAVGVFSTLVSGGFDFVKYCFDQLVISTLQRVSK